MMTYYNNDDELYHYGVLGMKWGIHRAKVNASKAKKARRKGNKKKAERYNAKSKKIMKKHVSRAGEKTVDRVSNMSAGKAFLQSSLMTTYGALKYNQFRTSGDSRAKSYIKAELYSLGNRMTGSVLSFAEPRLNENRS